MFFVKIVSNNFSQVIDNNMPSDTILSLKQSINKINGIPIKIINLSYNEKILEDNKKISDYEIKNYDKIDLNLKLLQINFFKSDAYELKWFVEEGTTVKELEKRILGKIYGVIFGIDRNHILQNGDIILLI